MLKLSKKTFIEINSYINKEARDLEKAVFNYCFNDAKGDDILDALKKYQNPDGGFGKGIESDFWLVNSSPMATSIGLKYLNFLGEYGRSQEMIAKAVEYLEAAFDSKRNGWYSVPSTINDYPHAPHWEYRSDIGMTVIDCSWGNPTAELIGYLYRYREYLSKLDIFSLLNYTIDKLIERTDFNSEHEIFCYIRMYNIIDEKYSVQIEDSLELAVSQLINVDEEQWTDYVPMPLKFIELDSKNFFGIDSKSIDKNLDYLIAELEENKKILPTWEWDDYLDEWETAKTEWIGHLTLEALLALKKFNRIEIE